MVKIKNSETLALKKSDQKKVVKKTKAIKKKISTGEISIHETRKQEKQVAEQKRGLIYIAHIPHGFYEEELRDYFKQFGNVTNVKVCRSCKTGNSKGYGYVEFAHPEVAKIAAETMNNYLMFKKRLEVTFVPFEKRPKSLFHGKSSTKESFTSKTRRGKQAAHKNREISPEEFEKQKNNIIKKLSKKLQKLKDHGVNADLELTNPLLSKLQENDLTHIYEPDALDSEVEYKVPLKKKKSSGSILIPLSSRKKTPLSAKTTKKQSTPKVKKVEPDSDAITSDSFTNLFNKTPKTKGSTSVLNKKLKEAGGIVKKSKKKNLVLKSDKVKKLAGELVKKNTDALVNIKKLTKKTLKRK